MTQSASPTLHPELARGFEALEREREALFARLRAEDPGRLHYREAPGTWSALQHLRHLIQAETASLAYLRKKLQYADTVRPAGLGARLRAGLLRTWFSLGVKAKAPASLGVPPEGEDPATVLAEYEALRAEWADALAGVPERLVHGELFRHGVAGRMALPQALAFFGTHFRHHAKAVDRLLAAAPVDKKGA